MLTLLYETTHSYYILSYHIFYAAAPINSLPKGNSAKTI